jgi:hypothetical protein
VGAGSVPVPTFFLPFPSGRVDLIRSGNEVTAATSGGEAFTLLLSPDLFDFTKPITVRVNGRTAFAGKLARRRDPALAGCEATEPTAIASQARALNPAEAGSHAGYHAGGRTRRCSGRPRLPK